MEVATYGKGIYTRIRTRKHVEPTTQLPPPPVSQSLYVCSITNVSHSSSFSFSFPLFPLFTLFELFALITLL